MGHVVHSSLFFLTIKVVRAVQVATIQLIKIQYMKLEYKFSTGNNSAFHFPHRGHLLYIILYSNQLQPRCVASKHNSLACCLTIFKSAFLVCRVYSLGILWIHPTQIAIVMKLFYLISKSSRSNILKIYQNVLSGKYISNVKSKIKIRHKYLLPTTF